MVVKLPVSVKTRLGVKEPEEFERLLDIYNRYPIACLTIHPRVQKQFYKGTVYRNWFAWAAERSRNPLCYNGDLVTVEDCGAFAADFPAISAVMIGRGSIGRPWIFREVKHYLTTGEPLPNEPFTWYLDILKQQVSQSVARLDERRGILHIRRHLAATPLFKGIPDFRQTRVAMLRAETVEELFAIMDSIPRTYRNATSLNA